MRIYWDSVNDTFDINHLLPQLSRRPKRLAAEELEGLLLRDNFFLFDVKEDGHIVAMATLVVRRTLMGSFGEIEDVVVDKKHRRKGLGEEVVRQAIEYAERLKLQHIDLSSRTSRRKANKLYRKLGFKQQNKKRNFYRLELA